MGAAPSLYALPQTALVFYHPAVISWKKILYFSAILGQEKSLDLFIRRCRATASEARADTIASAMAVGSSISTRYSSPPTNHRTRGLSCATMGRPHAMASRSTRGNGSSFEHCRKMSHDWYSAGIFSGAAVSRVNLPGRRWAAAFAIVARRGPSPATTKCASGISADSLDPALDTLVRNQGTHHEDDQAVIGKTELLSARDAGLESIAVDAIRN